MEAVFSTLAYFFVNWTHGWPGAPLAGSGNVYQVATTMTFAGIVLSQVGAVFGCRTGRASVFKTGLHTNRLVLIGIAAELLLLCALSCLPFLHGLFNTAPLGLREWAFLLWMPAAVLLIDELRKAVQRRLDRRRTGRAGELKGDV